MKAATLVMLVLAPLGVRAGFVFTNLHSFQGFANGQNPTCRLVMGNDGYFYGTASFGGSNGCGTVFRTGTNGSLATLYSFSGIDGSGPYASLVQGSDGYFYGTTFYGGTNGNGTVFQISSNGGLRSLYSFTGGNDGANPRSALVQDSYGYLYGTTRNGGSNKWGTVFKISTTGALTSLYSFTDGSDGASPQAALVRGADGYFYGTTYGGGTNYGGYLYGTVFKISTNGLLTSLHSFTGGAGAQPYCALVQGTDGFFYGTTIYGGLYNYGIVFKVATNGAFTNLYSFTGGNDGYEPEAGLLQASDGLFYGMTPLGGANGSGALFKITTNGSLTSLYSFSLDSGYNPGAELVEGSDGYFYGTTTDGGTNSAGTVFRVTSGGSLTTLYSFVGASDGASPAGGLVQGDDGYFYGTAARGGTNQYGTVFKIGTNGGLTSMYSFTSGNDGDNPVAPLVPSSDGYLYGTAQYGGIYGGLGYAGWGSIFKISTNGSITTLYLFTDGDDGSYPAAGLVEGRDGYFYGTTSFGGSNRYDGTVFRITATGEFDSLYSFTYASDGYYPLAGLAEGTDGYFYGTTSGGGPGGYGTVFRIATNGTLTTLYSFADDVRGGSPNAGLIQGSDGYFYGTTYGGGSNRNGTVFRISSSGSLTSLYSLGAITNASGELIDGANPKAGLIQGSNGYFYGTTYGGGAYGFGTVFEISTNGLLTSLYSFTGGNDGANPEAGLVLDSNGNLYGTASAGGVGRNGTVFRLGQASAIPVFVGATLTNFSLTLTWSTEVGSNYLLQYSAGLNSVSWVNFGGVVTATGATLSVTDSVASASCRFYRVAIVP